ncbi:hypothetical protein [Myroides marinus]|uniref:hypothetical protein n=1 Tax=Myroides marinus TaxID=703342 RepID=UPI002577603E|nr:hypothetical protein [Myroides marinus]MDM1345717.1 hypothetical protein [Myroides marinus]
MEMPTPCCNCKDVVELSDLRESNFTKDMLCDDCYSADLKQGFFYREGQKTSAGIEQLVNESEMASKATLRNQYY